MFSRRIQIDCGTLNVLSAHPSQRIPPSERFLAAALRSSLIEVCPAVHCLFSVLHPILQNGRQSAVPAAGKEGKQWRYSGVHQ